MPSTTAQQPKNIKDLLHAQTRVSPGSAQEKLVSRNLRNSYQQEKQKRRQQRGLRSPARKAKPLQRDSQEQDMNDGVQQPYGGNQIGEPLPAMSQPGNEFGAETPDEEEKDEENKKDGEEKEENEEEGEKNEEDEEQNPEQPESLAAQLRRQKREEKQKKEEKEEKEEAESAGVTERMKRATNGALQYAWWLMLAIITFLPGLAYVNLHVFLHWVLGDRFFCKLGEEWMPKQLKALSKETGGKIISKNMGLVEVLLLILLDLAAGAIIFGALGIVVMIVTWMGASWWGKLVYLYKALEALWGVGWGGVKAIVELFSK